MAIKNFKAKTQGPEKEQEKPILVSHYMTKKLICFKPDQSVLEVMDSLIKNNISGGPVVNEQLELLGMISEGDCMKQISESRYFNMPMMKNTVADYMATDVETIDCNMNVFDCASYFYKTGRKRFPIIENGKLIGQISRRDVLKAALELKPQNW